MSVVGIATERILTRPCVFRVEFIGVCCGYFDVVAVGEVVCAECAPIVGIKFG